MPFANQILGGQNKLIRPSIQSPNYVPGSAGWTVNKDGSAEFNDLVIRGQFFGAFFFIDSTGAFFYDPVSGFLIASIASASGINRLGDAYLGPGFATYTGGVFATLFRAGTITVFGAPGPAGPWTQAAASLVVTGSTVTLNGLIVDLNAPVTATAGNAGSPTVITTDSWNSVTPPANTSGTLRYRLMPDKTVMVEVQLTVSASAAAGTLQLLSGLAAAYTPAVQQRDNCGFVANGTPTLAQLQAMSQMRWQANPGGTFNVLGFVGGAAGSGVVELSFNARYSTD